MNVLEANISDTNVKDLELYFINLYDAIDNGYNKIRQGNSKTLEVRKKLSESNKGKTPSEETRNKMSKSRTGEKNPMYGKNSEDYMTPEAIILKRQHMSESRKGMIFNEEHRRKISDAVKKYWANKQRETRIWINNNNVEKLVSPDELQKYIDLGYQRGRKYKKRCRVS